jgi:predicted DNA-binding transcriptional regulator AlpA
VAAPARPKVARLRRKASHAPEAPPALPPDDELWDVHATARFLKRSLSWVYHRAEDGTLPVRRLGGWGLRFIPSEVRAWVESGGVAPARHRK